MNKSELPLYSVQTKFVPIHQYTKKYEYLHVLSIFSNFVFNPKDQMAGGILFLSCLSVVKINNRYNF